MPIGQCGTHPGGRSPSSSTVSNWMRQGRNEVADYFVKFLQLDPKGVINARDIRLIDEDTAMDAGIYTFTLSEARKAPGSTALTEAVARYYFKLMAYKDEYEVARLYTSGEFRKRIEQQFEGDYKIHFNLAPPLFAKRDADGHLVKKEFGPWMFTAFKLLAKMKGLRGTAFDIFGKTEERRMERQLIADYAKQVDALLERLDDGNVALATEIASVPEHIRGYGHVKEAHLAKAKAREAELLAQWPH